MCTFYADIRPAVTNEVREEGQMYTEQLPPTAMAKQYIKCQNLNCIQDGSIGTVKIGGKKEPICVPSYTSLTGPGIASKMNMDWPYLKEQEEKHNLPNGLVVKSCYSTPKARRPLVTLINITDKSICIR